MVPLARRFAVFWVKEESGTVDFRVRLVRSESYKAGERGGFSLLEKILGSGPYYNPVSLYIFSYSRALFFFRLCLCSGAEI